MKYIIGLMLITLGFMSCNRQDKPFVYVDPLIKSIFDYKAGSYWIMQDSVTGQIDSFVVDSIKRQIWNESDKDYEDFGLRIYGYRNAILNKTIYLHLMDGSRAIFSMIYSPNESYVFNDFCSVIKELKQTNLTVSGNAYAGVYYNTMQGKNEVNNNIEDTLNVWAQAGLGFVKVNLFTPLHQNKWNLIRSKVNQ